MGTVKGEKEPMTTIQVRKSIAAQLQSLGKWGDTYSSIIERLLNGINPGRKGEPHEDRGVKTNESTRNGYQQAGQERR